LYTKGSTLVIPKRYVVSDLNDCYHALNARDGVSEGDRWYAESLLIRCWEVVNLVARRDGLPVPDRSKFMTAVKEFVDDLPESR
jgi:hypothetical protein